MKINFYLTVLFVATASVGYSQANTALSNLTTTAINQDLLPNANNTRNLGSPSKSWQILFVDSSICLKDTLFFHNKGMQNFFAGSRAGYSITSGGYNSGFGYHTLYLNTMGSNNSAYGYRTLNYNTSGSANTAIGTTALYKNTSASNNTAVGYQTLYSNTNTGANTAIGTYALYSNGIGADVNLDQGTRNTAIGYESMYANTTGLYNTAVGNNSLYSNISGYFNTAIGLDALEDNMDGTNNTAIGLAALDVNTHGNFNTAEGSRALQANTTGNNNVANGFSALYNNTTGYSNIAVGASAFYNSLTSYHSIAIGDSSLYKVTNSYDNTAVGSKALYYLSAAAYNTAIGSGALYFNAAGPYNTALGYSALFYDYNGGDNTAVGYKALITSSGSDNTAIGSLADVSSREFENVTAIGYKAIVTASNKVRIGNSDVSIIEGQVPFSTPSDQRFKLNIKDDVKGLAFINKLKPVTYQFDTKKFDQFLTKNIKDSVRNKTIQNQDFSKSTNIIHNGFLAQQVEQAIKETGYQFDGLHTPENDNDYYSLAYSQFVVPLVKAVQELDKKNTALEDENKKQDEEIAVLKQMIQQLAQNRSLNISNSYLSQNLPNPTNGNAIIPFQIATGSKTAALQIIQTASGKVLQTIPLNVHAKQVTLNTNSFSAGSYMYILIVDGKQTDSRQMMLIK